MAERLPLVLGDDLKQQELQAGDSISLPANDVGSVLFSIDGVAFTEQTPLVGTTGWLVNDEGTLIVVG